MEIKIQRADGLRECRRLLTLAKEGKLDGFLLEGMACPGGCAGGGGQPIHEGKECAAERGNMLWNLDKHSEIRYSHENPDVAALYRTYLKKPLGERSHALLHVHGYLPHDNK